MGLWPSALLPCCIPRWWNGNTPRSGRGDSRFDAWLGYRGRKGPGATCKGRVPVVRDTRPFCRFSLRVLAHQESTRFGTERYGGQHSGIRPCRVSESGSHRSVEAKGRDRHPYAAPQSHSSMERALVYGTKDGRSTRPGITQREERFDSAPDWCNGSTLAFFEEIS